MHGFLSAALAITALAAVADARAGEMPRLLTLGTLLLAPLARAVYAPHIGMDASVEAGASILGAVGCALVPFFLYRQGALGGGEVKLFAALGALLHLRLGLEALTYSFLAAALLAPARLAYEGKLLRTLKASLLLFLNFFLPAAKRRRLDPELMTWFRMGPAIFLGVAVTALLHWRGV